MYHYVLAWTGEQATAVDLTTSVLRTAVSRMDQLVDGADADELEVRLMALLRASVIERQARSGRPAAPTAVPEESLGLFEALAQLDDTQREVLVLCDLLGQDPGRVARLVGCDREVLDGLREAGAESLWQAMNDAPEDVAVSTWQRLTVGAALRQAAADWLRPADGAVLAYVGERLFGEAPVGVPASPTRRGAPNPAPPAPAAGAETDAPARDGERAPQEPSPAAIAKANAKVGPKAAAAAAALAKGRAAATPADVPPKATPPAAPPGAPPRARPPAPSAAAPPKPAAPGAKPAAPGARPATAGGRPGDGASAPVPPVAAKAAAANAAAKLGGPAAAAAAAPRAETATPRETATPWADPKAQSKAAPRLQPRTGADGQPPATGNGQAKGDGGAAAAAAVAAAAGQGTQQAKGATTGEQPRDKASGGALAWLRGRWAAWGIAAVAAAVLGVVAALTIGSPVSGSPDCPSALSCLPSTTLAANGRNTLPPGPPPTDAAGNLVPTSSLAGGGFVPAPGFPLVTGTSQTTTTGPDGRVPTTTRGTATTAQPPKTTKPPGPTSPPTTAEPTTTEPPTTEPPTTEPPTTNTTPTLPLP